METSINISEMLNQKGKSKEKLNVINPKNNILTKFLQSKNKSFTSLNSTEDLRNFFKTGNSTNKQDKIIMNANSKNEHLSTDIQRNHPKIQKNDYLKNDKIKKFLIEIEENFYNDNSNNYKGINTNYNKNLSKVIEQNSKIKRKINKMKKNFQPKKSAINRPVAIIDNENINLNFYQKISPINTKMNYLINGIDTNNNGIKRIKYNKKVNCENKEPYQFHVDNIHSIKNSFKVSSLKAKNDIEDYSKGFININLNNNNNNKFVSQFQMYNKLIKNDKFNKLRDKIKNKSYLGVRKTQLESINDL